MRPTRRTTISPRLVGVLAGLGGLAVLASLAGCAAELPTGAEAIREYSGVGDCLRPDPATLDGFVQADCDDDLASVEIIEMIAGPGAGAPPLCPPGTDLLVDGEQGPVADGEIAAVPQVWCLRNLEPPHPGDPGEGGGELIPDDCFGLDRSGAVIETACDGRDSRFGEVPERRLVAVEHAADACPTGTDAIELDGAPPQALCAIDLLDGSP